MTNYDELRKAFEMAKEDVKKDIAAILVQAKEPLTAKDISILLDEMISVNSVSNFCVLSSVDDYLRAIGYRLITEKRTVYSTYVNVKNPKDVIHKGAKYNFYSAVPLTKF